MSIYRGSGKQANDLAEEPKPGVGSHGAGENSCILASHDALLPLVLWRHGD